MEIKEFTFDDINTVGEQNIIATYKPDGKRVVSTKITVWLYGPNLRSTEVEGAPVPHLFFKTSDGLFLNAKHGGEQNGAE